jgi:hypothetical protein
VKNFSPHTKNTLLQAATSQPTKQSLQESIFSPTQEKRKNKKSPTLQKNKTSQPHNLRLSGTLTVYDFNKIDGFTGQGRSRASANMGLASCGVTCLNSSAVFQINFSAGLTVLCPEIPHERQAQNRYRQG